MPSPFNFSNFKSQISNSLPLALAIQNSTPPSRSPLPAFSRIFYLLFSIFYSRSPETSAIKSSKFPKIFYLLSSIFYLPVASALAHPAAQDMSNAAANLLAALDPAQKSKATYAFTNDERFDWHFIPKPRKGLPLKEMTPYQRHLAQALLSAGLSQQGYIKAVSIMSLEDTLRLMEAGQKAAPGIVRDPELYYFTVFGEPSSSSPWGYSVE